MKRGRKKRDASFVKRVRKSKARAEMRRTLVIRLGMYFMVLA
jgi:hypothetical protein